MSVHLLKNISAKCLYSVPVVVVSTKYPHTVVYIYLDRPIKIAGVTHDN